MLLKILDYDAIIECNDSNGIYIAALCLVILVIKSYFRLIDLSGTF